jgi:hypothetical protein
MDIWQRGTSIAIPASTSYVSGFTSDRWQTGTGANQAITVSRQLVSDATNLPFIQYCARYQRNSGQTGTGNLIFAQSFESANSVPLAGRAVTLSFYARAGANFSAASSALTYQLYTGTGTDQNIFSGAYTGAVAAISTTATLTTTWQRFTAIATLATNTNEIATQFYYTPVGTAGTNDYYEITGVQVELGSYATTYTRSAGTIQGELSACQRYYWRANSASNAFTLFALGYADGPNSALMSISIPSYMRVFPTSIDFSNMAVQEAIGGGLFAISSFTISAGGATSPNNNIVFQANTSGLTNGRTARLLANNSLNAFIGFNSEL